MKYLQNIWIVLALIAVGAWAFLKYAPASTKAMVSKPLVLIPLAIVAMGALWGKFKAGNTPAAS